MIFDLSWIQIDMIDETYVTLRVAITLPLLHFDIIS